MVDIFLLETLSGYLRSLHYSLLPSLERLPPKAEEFFLPMRLSTYGHVRGGSHRFLYAMHHNDPNKPYATSHKRHSLNFDKMDNFLKSI